MKKWKDILLLFVFSWEKVKDMKKWDMFVKDKNCKVSKRDIKVFEMH